MGSKASTIHPVVQLNVALVDHYPMVENRRNLSLIIVEIFCNSWVLPFLVDALVDFAAGP